MWALELQDVIGITLIAGILTAISSLFISTWWELALCFIASWVAVFFADRHTGRR
jgi:hypothetical protein